MSTFSLRHGAVSIRTYQDRRLGAKQRIKLGYRRNGFMTRVFLVNNFRGVRARLSFTIHGIRLMTMTLSSALGPFCGFCLVGRWCLKLEPWDKLLIPYIGEWVK